MTIFCRQRSKTWLRRADGGQQRSKLDAGKVIYSQNPEDPRRSLRGFWPGSQFRDGFVRQAQNKNHRRAVKPHAFSHVLAHARAHVLLAGSRAAHSRRRIRGLVCCWLLLPGRFRRHMNAISSVGESKRRQTAEGRADGTGRSALSGQHPLGPDRKKSWRGREKLGLNGQGHPAPTADSRAMPGGALAGLKDSVEVHAHADRPGRLLILGARPPSAQVRVCTRIIIAGLAERRRWRCHRKWAVSLSAATQVG